MTLPRNVRPDVTWFVTRRTVRRHFLLNPDQEGEIEQIYWYTTGYYAQQLGIELHVIQVMSNHTHETMTDGRAELSRFLELRNRAFANAVKVLRGWSGEVFDKRPACWVELRTPEAVVDKMAYTIANCVKAGLVRTPRRWPGAKVLVDDLGRKVIKVKRPRVYFDPEHWPDEVTIPIVMPKKLEERYGSPEACRAAIQVEVDRHVRAAHAQNEQRGCGYLGAKRVLKQPHTGRADSEERSGALTPTFATGGDPAVAQALIEERDIFLTQYRRALQAWREGIRDVLFPFGTWKMRRYHAVRCHAAPT